VSLIAATCGTLLFLAVQEVPTSPPEASTARLEQGTYTCDGPLVVRGFFRIRPQTVHPTRLTYDYDPRSSSLVTTEHGLAPLTRLPERYVIDVETLHGQIRVPEEPAPRETTRVLTSRLRVSRTGETVIDYTGASPGMIAMRGGRRKPGVEARYHAVEAENRQPVHFAVEGVPAPAQGSLTMRLDGFHGEVVATRLTLNVAGGDGVILVHVAEDGSMTIAAGS